MAFATVLEVLRLKPCSWDAVVPDRYHGAFLGSVHQDYAGWRSVPIIGFATDRQPLSAHQVSVVLLVAVMIRYRPDSMMAPLMMFVLKHPVSKPSR